MKWTAIAAAALVLAGCGGGGDASEAPVASLAAAPTAGAAGTASAAEAAPVAAAPGAQAEPSTPTAVAAGPAMLPLAAAAPAAASSDRTADAPKLRAAVLQVLQDERRRCGFSPVAANAELDEAAARHGRYLADTISDGGKGAHTEVPGTPGFSGQTPTDRARAAGYAPKAVNEAFAHSSLALGAETRASTALPADRAASHTRFLLSTVYHLQVLVGPRRDLGVGYTEQSGRAAFTQVTVLEFGLPSGAANAPQEGLLTYPCEGTTAAFASFVPAKENPNPLPAAGDAAVGTPLYLRAPEGRVLVLRSHRVSGPDGAALATTVLDAANDPNDRLTAAQAFVLPQKPLAKGVTYRVEYTGTVDGVPFDRAFSFKPA